ncbi:hypothetical protein HBI56_211160 [Parastagonospora nodorum]|nr:hypothetical protein HBH53_197210 [Parastagonospora nodorum]KAH3960955.1 hypothetical protein HBH51_187030 [Parastagonospora nodorum]KAH4046735.1 hypothetical protein HBH49_179900 [Parastagonospora nodorum]KAH4159224.1 hypothetical protein HBH43_188770 [Parastagonospora nodorum]KAH4286700.1 hypothetical protein HBI02_222150 [Parastagonospora nodorum]
MANEEQRRAFASYMGTASASAGQQAAQTSGAYTNAGNPYLYQQQFPGIQGLPAAPTPPPAAPSSVASYPSYTGAYQGGYPQAGFRQGGYQQSAFPQRPPPLGQSETLPGQQSMQQQSGQPNYYQTSGNYSNQQQIAPGYNSNWQHADPMSPQNGNPNGYVAARNAMVPSPRNFSGEIVEDRRRQVNEQYHYHQYGQPQPVAEPAPPQVDEQTVPVLLCHTCSVCSSMRSAGYHRNNPVVPGKPLVLTPCRRCKKKIKSRRRSMSSFMRIRSCTAEDPCDWPSEAVHVDMERKERRGRQPSREDVYVYRHSPSRPRIIRQSSSQTRFGLRALQHEQATPRVFMNEGKVRVSSLSPGRHARYDGVWPPPDVVRINPSKPEVPVPVQTNPHVTSSDEVWPPPDGVRTHFYRKDDARFLRSQSSRIIELSPSPPPARARSTRVVYRSESVERRPRSVTPVRVIFHEEQRSEEAEARMMAHPRPYRPVVADRRNFARVSEETSSSTDYMPRGRQDSPSRGILKPTGGERETSRRRMSMRESQQSTTVEIGGPRVHFGAERREGGMVPPDRGRQRYADEARRPGDDHEHYRDYARHRYVDDPPPAPPVEEMERVRIRRASVEDMERVRIRRASVSPRRSYEEEIRIDRARRLSPSPQPPPPPLAPRHYEEIRVRHVSPLPPRERTPRPPPSPPSPERPFYRHVARQQAQPRPRSATPPRVAKPASDDMTDSDSAHSGEVTEVRSWRGIDENGQPATFVEERRTGKTIEQGSERGGLGDYRNLGSRAGERVGSRQYREV